MYPHLYLDTKRKYVADMFVESMYKLSEYILLFTTGL